MRRCLVVTTAALLLSVPSVALAQGACPPGSWFCDEEEPPLEGDEEGWNADDEAVDRDYDPEADADEDRADPPVVVYEPADGKKGDKIIVVDRDATYPPPPKRRSQKEWGLNLRLQGVMMGQDEHGAENAEMGGIGFSFRYRPVGHFALDIGVDLLGGIDWAGNERSERALSINGIIYFNPKSKLQVYTLGGLGFSAADVQLSEQAVGPDGSIEQTDYVDQYTYFGGQLGLGLEWRVGRKVALNADVIGFIRGRTDDKARYEPEFTDPDTGRTTNTSGGGLFRGGITFYW